MVNQTTGHHLWKNFISSRVLSTVVLIFLANSFSVVFSQSMRTSVQTGNWTNQNTWDCNCVPATTDDITIKSGHTVTFVSNGNLVRNLTIESGGILSDNGNTNTITGNLKLYGTYTGSGVISLTGTNATIEGTGTISNTGSLAITGHKTILAGSILTKNSGDVVINSATIVTNAGTVTFGGIMRASNATTSIWINSTDSRLNVAGSVFVQSNRGVLNASAPGNTVNYFGAGSQVIYARTANQYHHLIISGGSTDGTSKTLGGDIIVNGNLTISHSLSAGINRITLYGNLTSTGVIEPGTGTITVAGAQEQSFSFAQPDTLHNFTVNKVAGSVTVNNGLTVGNALTMSSTGPGVGNIDMGSNTLTLGLSALVPGSLFYSGGGSIVGEFEQWIDATGTYLFPVGVTQFNRPVTMTIHSLQSSGTIRARFSSAYPGNNGLPLTEASATLKNTFRDGLWELAAGNQIALSSYDVAVTGNGFTGFPAITSETRLLGRTATSGPWTLNGTHGTNSANTVLRDGVTLFPAHFALGDNSDCDAPVTTAISGATSVCKVESGSPYSVTSHDGSTYQWAVSGGAISSGQGTASVMVDWGTTGMNGSMSVLESNACTSGETKVVNVSINPLAPASISGKLNVPQNSSTPVVYTVDSGDFTSFAWTVSGGSIVGNVNGNSLQVIWGPAGLGEICVKGINACGESELKCSSVNIYKIIKSVKSGNWRNDNTWDCGCDPVDGDNITILNTHSVNLNGNEIPSVTLTNLTIDAGGTLNVGRPLIVRGDLAINGTLAGGNSITLAEYVLNGNVLQTYLQGTGTISNTVTMTISGSKTIPANSSLTKLSGSVTIGPNVTITNYGSMVISGNLIGGATQSASRIWINEANSNLSVGGSLFTGNTGILRASANGNTVRYYGPGTQAVKIPVDNQYHHLTFFGGLKTLPLGLLKLRGNLDNSSTISPGSNTIEFNGNTTISGPTHASFNNIHITGILSPSPESTINIAGNMIIDGSFIHNNGTVIFNGSSASAISGTSGLTTFTNITAGSTGGVNNTKAIEILGVLNVDAAASFNANGAGNGSVVLRSRSEDTSMDASVGPLLGNAQVTGNVTVQRFMASMPRIYRYLSSPVQDATLQQWRNSFYITGNIPNQTKINLCGYTVSPTSPSVFYFDETVPGGYSSGYAAYPATAAIGLSSPLVPGVGYAAYIRNCTNIVVNVTGQINQGDFPFSLSYTSSTPEEDADGYNLVGNPYPSSIDWASTTGWQRSDSVSLTAAVTDNNASGAAQFVYLDASDGIPQIIASGQAFWVQATGQVDNTSLVINETAKTTSSGSFYRQDAGTMDQLIISLSNGLDQDKAYVKLRPFAKKERDRFDAVKLNNGIFDVYTLSADEQELAINSTPEVICGEPMQIGIRNIKPGDYSIALEALGVYRNFDFTVIDDYTKAQKKFEGGTYNFSVTTDPASFHPGRFKLAFQQKVNKAPVVLDFHSVTCEPKAKITVLKTIPGIQYQLTTSGDSLLANATATADSIVFNLPSETLDAGLRTFRVTSILSCGGIGETAVASIDVSEPLPVIEIDTARSCGSGNVVLNSRGAGPGDKVTWYENENDMQAIYTGPAFFTHVLDKTSTFYAQVVNEKGCRGERIAGVAEIVRVDPPVISEADSILHSSAKNTVWFFEGHEIGSGEKISILANGVYTAEVSFNGCVARTDYAVHMTSLVEQSLSPRPVYPNPFISYINIPMAFGETIQSVVIQDAAGRIVELKRIEAMAANADTYDVSFLTGGIYLIKVKVAEKVRYAKLVKH